MSTHPSNRALPAEPSGFWARPWSKVWIAIALIGGFYLLREHWGHVLGLWPYLLLAACPLMHLMHGHGGHRHGPHHGHAPPEPRRDQDRPPER